MARILTYVAPGKCGVAVASMLSGHNTGTWYNREQAEGGEIEQTS